MESKRIDLKLEKAGLMRFISHLDFVRLTYRVLRRSGLSCEYTRGYSRRPKVKFGPAAKVGEAAEMEVSFFLNENVSLPKVKEKLNKQLTQDLRITEISYGK